MWARGTRADRVFARVRFGRGARDGALLRRGDESAKAAHGRQQPLDVRLRQLDVRLRLHDGLRLDASVGWDAVVFTGPSSDHTSGSGYYMYVEASGNYPNVGPFTLLSPTFAECVGEVNFYYHLYAAGRHGHAAARGDDGRRELDDDLDEVGRPGRQLAGRDREHRDGERDPSAMGRDYGIELAEDRHRRRRGHPERGNVADTNGRGLCAPHPDNDADTVPTPAPTTPGLRHVAADDGADAAPGYSRPFTPSDKGRARGGVAPRARGR